MSDITAVPRLHFTQEFNAIGVATNEDYFDIRRESVVRVVIENSNTNNTVRCEGKLTGQDNWSSIGSISQNSEITLNLSKVDEVRFIVEVYHANTGSAPRIIVSGFTY